MIPAVVVGLLAVAGGFFLHMARGEPGLLALATLFLACLIIAV